MVEFKVVIGDPKTGKCYQRVVDEPEANALIGKKIGDEIDGRFVSLPGYKLKITGGSDKDGVPMRWDISGPGRRRVLVSESTGFHPKDRGVRRRRLLRGNTISSDISQINMKIVKYGPKSIEDLFAEKEEKGEK
ncbi:MAG: 30S ribosomal protein S6e [Thermoplasmata archaeon]|nr:MAG: 30S ribosomal protein S6e [Thermoplasmata archaeon]